MLQSCMSARPWPNSISGARLRGVGSRKVPNFGTPVLRQQLEARSRMTRRKGAARGLVSTVSHEARKRTGLGILVRAHTPADSACIPQPMFAHRALRNSACIQHCSRLRLDRRSRSSPTVAMSTHTLTKLGFAACFITVPVSYTHLTLPTILLV